MKKTLICLMAAFAFNTAQANNATFNSKKEMESLKLTQSSPKRLGEGGGISVGIAGSTLVTGTTTAASVLFHTSPMGAVQTYFGIGSSSPFTFGLGAIYQATVVGSESAGFHAGAGLGLGTTAGGLTGTLFFVNILGNAGVHFQVPSMQSIRIAVDMGPALTIVDGDVGFQLAGYSPLLGLSLHYEL